MAKPSRPIRGIVAPPPRPTKGGALWIAGLVALPVGGILWLGEALWRLLF